MPGGPVTSSMTAMLATASPVPVDAEPSRTAATKASSWKS